MSYGISSDEVAEDYRKALEDLNMNSRYEISNLTVIAKENNEHAMAISEALKDHIKQCAPPKKLPAFYVLDSIVKNVGTPYTLFFGRNLYSTFMEAYALVDGNVRRKMEEMLQTWKQPVPGSLDTRPVFPADVTRPIENALIKFRTSALQAHQEYARNQQQLFNRGRPSTTPYRNTPTPPMTRSPFQGPSQNPPQNNSYLPNGQSYPNQSYPSQQYGNQQPSGYPPATGTPQPWQREVGGQKGLVNMEVLHSDIANLIAESKAAFARNPTDIETQTRLKALIDLQEILTRQNLPSDQIVLIRERVSEMQQTAPPPPAVSVPPVAPVPAPIARNLPHEVVPTPPPNQQQPTLSSLFGANALAALPALLAKASAIQQSSTPPVPSLVRSPQPRYSSIEPVPVPAAIPAIIPTPAPAPDTNTLIEQLRAAGLLPAALQSSLPVAPPSTQPTWSGVFPPQPPVTRTPLAEIPNDVQLNPTSLKIPRPHLISSLYEKLGVPCTQCGRRFKGDEEGKRKKEAHMDWHFRVHQRMSDAEKRGQHRSWYVDELDWIKSREADDSESTHANGGIVNAVEPIKPKQQYVAVPDDPVLANSPCPICQDKFEMKWLDDAQEFVWMDAVKVGGRIYHASCYAEAKRNGGDTPSHQRGTPEPVLGKRKAEDDLPTRVKIKSEPH